MTLTQFVSQRGKQAELAKAMCISPVLIHQWATQKRRVPTERCKEIELATEGEVMRHELRPDIFDAPVTT